MSACNPNDTTVNPPILPPLPNPGFGIPMAPIQIPFPGVELPTGLIQDLQELVNSLGLVFPSSTFKPTVDNFTKVVFDLIANLLTQIAPFLSFYNFITALMNMIVCIIEVLCALTNPFKLIRAVRRLFRECIPSFVRMFPWMALIAIIIALLLLIVALIEYLISTIKAIVDEIIRNVKILSSAISFQDSTVTLKAIQKLAELLCLVQNTLAILLALSAVMAIIESLALVSGRLICDDNGPCCTPDVCPPFIRNSPITGTTAQLIYASQVNTDVSSIFGGISGLPGGFNPNSFNMPPIRIERWELVETQDTLFPFSSIITPGTDPATSNTTEKFWPEGITFNARTPTNRACYTCDIRFAVDPAIFNIADSNGERYFRVLDCIVVREPYLGTFDYAGNISYSNTTGTLNLEGGLVFEDDGTTPFMIDGVQATINNFIHLPIQTSYSTAPNNLQTFTNVEYTLKPVYESLMSYQLITVGCVPEVSVEKAVFNSVLAAEDVRAVFEKLQPTPAGQKVPSSGILPNVQGTQDCVNEALEKFRKNVTLESAALFQAEIETCLNDLKNQSLAALCGALNAAVSQFKSEATLSTDIEFTTRPIKVTVVLKDAVGTNISLKMPQSCSEEMIKKLSAEATLGEVSDFVYNGSSFTADLTSRVSGSGVLNILFDGKVLSSVVQSDDESSSQIVEQSLNYTFVDATVEPIVRRDITDKE